MIIINTQNFFAGIIHPLFSTPCWLRMCYGLNLPPLSWEHPICLSSSPLLKNYSLLICVVVPVAVASILPLSLCHRVFLFCNRSDMGKGFSLSTAMLIPRLGLRKVTLATCCKLRKGKSHPSCFHVWCQWGYMLIIASCLGLFGGQASFCIVLCGIHCLDHAGCQGCCCDTNDIWDTSVPFRYFESLGH